MSYPHRNATPYELVNLARIEAHGYRLIRHGDKWTLRHESDLAPTGCLMIGNDGCTTESRWRAIAEALSRIYPN